jgi:Mg2+ and Co2+ transporter CorA
LLALTSTKNFIEYYLIIINDFSLNFEKDYKIKTYEIPIGKTQVEAVKIIDRKNFWITSEDERNSKFARLMKLSL